MNTIYNRVRRECLVWSLLVILLTALFACDKDELTEPATVTCAFLSTSKSVMNGQLDIERFDVTLSELHISGRRINENDMFFTRKFDFENGYFKVLDPTPPSTLLQIPQGSYETLVFYSTLAEDDFEFDYYEDDDDDETNDLSIYLTRAKPGILISGRYTNGGTTFPVIVSLNDDIRRFALNATQNGQSAILLQKAVPSLASMTFDLPYLFVTISSSMIENAMKFPLGNEQAVFISDEYNEQLYNQLVGRIQGSIQLTVEQQ